MMRDRQPGYRFFPTEEELITFYLKNMLNNNRREDIERLIPIADIYARDPQHLPGISGLYNQDDTEQWFFFSPMQVREAQGGRPNRTTLSGYWKATGSPSWVRSNNNRIVGNKKTMVFYKGRAPTGRKTEWKMNEYRALQEETATTPTAASTFRAEFSLCRVYLKSRSRSFDRRPRFVAERPASSATADTRNSLSMSMEERIVHMRSSMSFPDISSSENYSHQAEATENKDLELDLMTDFDDVIVWDSSDWA